MRNPNNILKLWLKSVKLYEGGKKPNTFPKKVQEFKLKIKNGLTKLKTQAAHDLTTSAHQAAFAKTRDQLAKVMLLYIRFLKTSKDENKKLLPKFLKTVMRLTSLVKGLDPANVDLEEQESSIDSLENVSTEAVEQALTQPAEEEAGDDDFGAEEDAEPEAEDIVPPAPPLDEAAQWAARRKALEPRLLQALKDHQGDANKFKALFAFAQQKAEHGEFAAALQGLEALEKALDGITPTVGAEGEFPRLWEAAKSARQTASDTVDAQISQLQNALRTSGFDELKEVSEFGLNGVTGNFKVPLLAALRNIDAARGATRQQEAAKAQKVIVGFKQHLEKEELVTVCDDNPFGVAVTIRQTLGGALDQLQSALQQAT